MTDDRLDLMLTSLGADIEWPEPSTGFSQRVVARISAEPQRRPLLRRFVPAFGAFAVLLAVLLTFSPATRAAVADLLGIGGVRIQYGPDKGLPTPRTGASLDLGHAVTLEEARTSVDFVVLVPELLGAPDQVYFDPIVPGGMVSLIYGPAADLEPAAGTDVAVLLTQFRGELLEDGFFKKMLGTSTIERVSVNGGEGYWISGEAHSFFFQHDDRVVEETLRLVEKVLLWEQDGVTLRIETAGTLVQALEIATSLR